jgi:hypothetical protein
MRFLWRGAKRLLAVVVVLALVLLAPVAWVEVACRGTAVADGYTPLIAEPAWRRAESRTYTTYPEWHIVYAYQDYAAVIRTGDPHDYGYLSGIAGFWRALCPLARTAAAHGGFDWNSKATIYTIGESFTADMALKAAYEETVGRTATWVRGTNRALLDDISARQAADYAIFLHQVPWYRWDFRRDALALDAAATPAFRDRERSFALGVEYGAKAAYAGAIAQAVAGVGADALRMRSVVTGLTPEVLGGIAGVTVIGIRPEGVEIETDRYAAFTELARVLAAAGADFVEIAGNDDIMLTVLTAAPEDDRLYTAARQGFGDSRQLLDLKVTDLARTIRELDGGPERLEHVHDY